MDANEFFRGCLLPAYRHGLGVERMAVEPDACGRLPAVVEGLTEVWAMARPHAGSGTGPLCLVLAEASTELAAWARLADAGELPEGLEEALAFHGRRIREESAVAVNLLLEAAGNEERLVDTGDLPRFETASL